jgi:hypothetical protein
MLTNDFPNRLLDVERWLMWIKWLDQEPGRIAKAKIRRAWLPHRPNCESIRGSTAAREAISGIASGIIECQRNVEPDQPECLPSFAS